MCIICFEHREIRMGSIGEWNWAIAASCARYTALEVQNVFSNWSTPQKIHPPLHEIIFCASNLAFACELYLKSCCVACTNHPAPTGHKLKPIFENVPKPDRKEILEIYERIFDLKYKNLENGEIWLKLSDAPPPKEKRPATLIEVLEHYSSSYQDWRYIFALSKKTSPSNLRCLHYSRLMCLCEAIDRFLQNRFPEIIRKSEITILR